MNDEGFVHLPGTPGLGYRLVEKYITDNAIG